MFDAASGMLNLSGVASVAAYQQVLRSVTYSNTGATTFSGPQAISFQVNDGFVASNTASRTFVVDPHPWQNPALRWDVNDDGLVTPIDALDVINQLNKFGEAPLALPRARSRAVLLRRQRRQSVIAARRFERDQLPRRGGAGPWRSGSRRHGRCLARRERAGCSRGRRRFGRQHFEWQRSARQCIERFAAGRCERCCIVTGSVAAGWAGIGIQLQRRSRARTGQRRVCFGCVERGRFRIEQPAKAAGAESSSADRGVPVAWCGGSGASGTAGSRCQPGSRLVRSALKRSAFGRCAGAPPAPPDEGLAVVNAGQTFFQLAAIRPAGRPNVRGYNRPPGASPAF